LQHENFLSDRLPPLNALGAFEAAVRLGSLSRAADELSVTQSAISHRIRALEIWAGHKLLLRLSRGVEPTAHGARILESVTTALTVLRLGARQLRRASRSVIRISVLPSFAAYWLVPRLGPFRELHPETALDIRVTWRLARLDRDEVDVALRSGAKEWPNVRSVRLLEDWYYPVCSPAYKARHGGLQRADDLGKVLLLGHSRESWTPWLVKAGVQDGASTPALVFSDAGLLLQAAAAHQGVALARHAIAAHFIERGDLVRLFDTAIRADHAYWAVTRKQPKDEKRISAFVDWLAQQGASFPPPD
jgi:LysR family transcriptional regulator, glycine cleavage system transcriptional activator